MPRKGGWVCTASGIAFYPLDPRPEDVVIEDIAHALAAKGRFGGATRHFYSVAEHSYRVALAVWAAYPKRSRVAARTAATAALGGLLHDGSEAYLVDLPRPIKHMFPAYLEVEASVQTVVEARFNLDLTPEMRERIAHDDVLLATERRDLMPKTKEAGVLPGKPLRERIRLTSYPEAARREFLALFEILQAQRSSST